MLAGPSGVGKSSVVAALRARLPDLFFSVSATTRAPRAGEVDGRDYHFVGNAGFDELIARGDLLEWAEIHGGLQRSGTPREPVERALAEGRPVLVEVDLHGARALKAAMPESVSVFVEPPSLDELERRLRERGTESPEQFARRLQTAREELAARAEFDVALVNEDVQATAERLVELMVGTVSVFWAPPFRSTRVSMPLTGARAGSVPEGITNPPIDDLLGQVSSKYALVIYAAKRARQINDYYSQLGEGLLEYVGPLVEPGPREKPLSIAMREIQAGLLEHTEGEQ